MKYALKDFNLDLKEKIASNEKALKDLIEKLSIEHEPFFSRKGMKLEAEFDRQGNDPFIPGYSSSISIAISDENGELTDLHIINIWECGRYFLGMPTSKNIPGSKIAGELLDDTFDEIQSELKEYIEEQLTESDE